MKVRFLAMVILGEAALSPLLAGVTTDGETLPRQGVERLVDGEINPTCAWRWHKKPIRVEFDLGEAREVGGVRFTSGRSWVNCGVNTASFYGDDGLPLTGFVPNIAEPRRQKYWSE